VATISIFACETPPLGTVISVEGEKVTVKPGTDGEKLPFKETLPVKGPDVVTLTITLILEAWITLTA
jgi:hypothetical protein